MMNEKIIQALIDDIKLDELPPKHRELVELIGLNNVITLSQYFQSTEMYIPNTNNILRSARNRSIRKEFTGDNYRELSRKYDLSDKQIKTILKERN